MLTALGLTVLSENEVGALFHPPTSATGQAFWDSVPHLAFLEPVEEVQ